jgi:hypothetical protein
MAKAATGRRPAGAGAEEDLGTFSSAWGVFGPEHVPYRMPATCARLPGCPCPSGG